jgi:hypothetical protein
VDPAEVVAAGQRLWERLRGRAVQAAQTPEYFDRLQNRKAQVSEALEKSRAARRFEGGETAPVAPPPAAQAAPAPPPRPPAPKPEIAPEKEQQPEDYASRLLKAKKRVWEQRDEPKG